MEIAALPSCEKSLFAGAKVAFFSDSQGHKQTLFLVFLLWNPLCIRYIRRFMSDLTTITMSKTFETNALKGKSLAAGMKQRIAELEKFGVKEADLTVMEQDADKAIEMIREVDSLREEVTRKLQAANEQLNSLRDRAAVYRKIIKQNYLQDQWAGFGLQDKR